MKFLSLCNLYAGRLRYVLMFFFVIKQSSAYSASFSGEEILLKFGCKLAPAKGL